MASKDESLAALRQAVAASRNRLPTLQLAIDAAASASNTPKIEADVAQLASCVTATLGQIRPLLMLSMPLDKMKSAADETLLRDLPDLRRDNLEHLLVRALEPPVTGFGLVLAAFRGVPKHAFLPDIKALASEIIDGLTVGEVRRRAKV
jgi:hypothetical protein